MKSTQDQYLEWVLLILNKVELQGIEPWSKHATNRLSTCLVIYWFSIMILESTPGIITYLLNFANSPKLEVC